MLRVLSRFQVTCILLTVCSTAPSRAESEVDFGRDIRPILSDNCFACHGPDEEGRQGGFRLDQREGALVEADSGMHPIVPGDPDASEIIRRITSDDPDEQMPPPGPHKPLNQEQIEKLRQWIADGAPWQQHWSLVAPTPPELPSVQATDWPINPIDHFILAKLEQHDLRPSAATDRITLLRRVTFDLTGLPPTLQEVDNFLADDRPGAYERVVDRLLASPQFGEHMARYWLDLARYGDTHGLHLDNYREMWLYRDWVVSALNDNMAYNQFVLEQIAGDLLPEPTQQQLIATGFNRCNVTTNEGGSIKEEVLVRNVVDRVDTFGTVFLGLTVGCTRCHDHKYDALTMHDYYSMFAYFNSLDAEPMDGNVKDHAPVIRMPTPEQQQRLAELESKLSPLRKIMEANLPEVDQAQAEWLQQTSLILRGKKVKQPSSKPKHYSLEPWRLLGPLVVEGDSKVLGQKLGPEGKPVDLQQRFPTPTGFAQWEKKNFKDDQVHRTLPVIADKTTVSYLYRKITAKQASTINVSLGSDDAIQVYLNNKSVLAKEVRRGAAPDQEKVQLDLVQGENHLLIKIVNYLGSSGFYFSSSDSPKSIPKEIQQLVKKNPKKLNKKQQTQLRKYFRENISTHDQLVKTRGQFTKLEAEKKKIDDRVTISLIWKEKKQPRQSYLLNRGEYDQRGEKVQRATPASLPPMNSEWSNDRLGLARWLTDPQHPLTARVVVNRYWQQLFGTGIVKTSEDFGSQGELPSHPQLLDWLALDFIDNGWDVKRTMKQLVMSATYRQSAKISPELYRKDPNNRLLARGPRFRLEAEMLRDQALAISGLLIDKIGGPSVKPPQPDGLWFAVAYTGSNTVRFRADKGRDKVHRRSLYTFIKRTAPPPQMTAFDGPSRESCSVRRERTNTPLQALLLLNDPQYLEAARGLAARTMREGGETVEEKATYLFRLCTCRRPNVEELAELVQAYREDLATYSKDAKAAQQFTAVGEKLSGQTLDTAELAAWMVTSSALLNIDEVVTKN